MIMRHATSALVLTPAIKQFVLLSFPKDKHFIKISAETDRLKIWKYSWHIISIEKGWSLVRWGRSIR